MANIKTAHIISHTHWDREWYLNSPYTNAWLVPFFEALFAMLEKEPAYRFVLDGQTSMIEDWVEQLEVRGQDSQPHLQRLQAFARQGRVCLGPYYLQPDWQLVSEESLVRNLLIGQQMAEQLGGRMKAGWLLDNFGQISQTAQIHREFGLNGLFVWRGVEMDPRQIQTEFSWGAPDGSQVNAVYLVGSYRNGMRLAEYRESMVGRIAAEIDKLSPFATTPNILLMNGYDQEMLPDDILPALRSGAGQVGRVRVVQSTPPDYLDAVRTSKPRQPLPVLRGALYSGRFISVFPGILSARMYLKQQNDACQKKLEQAAEPLSAWLWAMGQPYPGDSLDRCWRLLLKNQPHDSICGVSIDDVHSDMEERYRESDRIADGVIHDALRQLVSRIDTTGHPGAGKRWVVFNTSLKAQDALVELPASGNQPGDYVDSAGDVLPVQRNQDGSCVLALSHRPLGYQLVCSVEGQNVSAPVKDRLSVNPENRVVENELLKLVIAENGSISLTDKACGVTYPELGLFEDGGDAGDTYNYSYPADDQVLTTRDSKARVSFLEAGPLRARIRIDHQLRLPKALSHDRQSRSVEQGTLDITTLVTVEIGSEVVSFHSEVNNTLRDHRLRVLFPTGIQTDSSQAETQADVVSHAICPEPYDDSTIPAHVKRVILGAREPKPVTIFPQRGFVDLSDGARGLAVLNRGLPEYEILPENNTIALTLFRGVGWIARPDLLTRIGDAGPLIAVPDAQCLRQMTFDYAVLVHAGDWEAGEVVQQADAFNRQLLLVETGAHSGPLPSSGRFLQLDDPGDQLKVTAVKCSEDGQALVVRFHNPSNNPISARLRSAYQIKKACFATLAETPGESIPCVDRHTLEVRAAPKKMVTLCLELEPISVATPHTLHEINLVRSGADAGMANGGKIAASILPGDITAEAERAQHLEEALSAAEQVLQSFTAQDENKSDVLKIYRLRLEAASLRRTTLEARLSETLLRKNAWLASRKQDAPEGEVLAGYEAVLRRIGDEINTARVEKRALEYVVDYHASLLDPPSPGK